MTTVPGGSLNAKRLNSEIGRAVPLDFIFAIITETILILYPEYDTRERKNQELKDLERKRKEAQKVEEQRKQKELEAIRRREEEEECLKREDVLRGDINRIREIVRDCVCEILGEEPKEEIDDEDLCSDLGADELDKPEISMAIEEVLEIVTKTKCELPYELPGLTINEISKAISFYFKHGRYPKRSHSHSQVVAVSKIVFQLETDARTLKETLKKLKCKTGNEFSKALSESPLADNPSAGSVLIALFMQHAPPWSSKSPQNIENLISAAQVLIDTPNYSSDYGYDEMEADKE